MKKKKKQYERKGDDEYLGFWIDRKLKKDFQVLCLSDNAPMTTVLGGLVKRHILKRRINAIK